MKIKRFIAKDSAEAFSQVKETLGDDALIISNRNVLGGVEVICGIEYDDSILKYKPPTHSNKEVDTHIHTNQSLPLSKNIDSISIKAKQLKSNAISSCADDPSISAVHNELQSLRGLLEHQLSGLAWQDLQQRSPIEAQLMRYLLKLGFSPDYSSELAKSTVSLYTHSFDYNNLRNELMNNLTVAVPVINQDIISMNGCFVLVGPTGVGKTTSIAKIAAKYLMQHDSNELGIVSLDSQRIGATEQLKTYGRILGVPVRIVDDKISLIKTLETFYDKKLILIDTPGISKLDRSMRDKLNVIKEIGQNVNIYLTLSVISQRCIIQNIIKLYRHIGISGCILTKIDESTNLGATLDAIIKYKLPVSFYTDGQHVPNDIHVALAEKLITSAIQLMNTHSNSVNACDVTMQISGLVNDVH